MFDNVFRPDVGKSMFSGRQAKLEEGLRLLAAALGGDAQSNDLSGFFQEFMGNFWSPFDEVCAKSAKMQKGITDEIRAMEKELKADLAPDSFARVERYCSKLCERNSDALDYAFLVGYQCAIRFLLLGLAPAAQIYPQEVQR